MEQDTAITENGATLCIVKGDDQDSKTKDFKMQGAVLQHATSCGKHCACACTVSEAGDTPQPGTASNGASAGEGGRGAEALGWEEKLIITLYSFVSILKKK